MRLTCKVGGQVEGGAGQTGGAGGAERTGGEISHSESKTRPLLQ